jgi:hypothetical protein
MTGYHWPSTRHQALVMAVNELDGRRPDRGARDAPPGSAQGGGDLPDEQLERVGALRVARVAELGLHHQLGRVREPGLGEDGLGDLFRGPVVQADGRGLLRECAGGRQEAAAPLVLLRYPGPGLAQRGRAVLRRVDQRGEAGPRRPGRVLRRVPLEPAW